MVLCYPPDTDWSCKFTAEQMATMREDPAVAAQLDRSEALAWYTLASLTGYRIGVCPTVVRPCAARCAPTGSWMAAPVGGGHTGGLPLRTIGLSFTPHISGGEWVNSCGCAGSDSCSCGPLSEAILPGPIGDIQEIVIDGVILDPAAYRVDNGNRLVRQDGEQWPLCQDMSSPVGEFTVSYYRGAAPNEMTRFAAGILAAEFYTACTDSGKCRLPRGVTAVTRYGTTMEIDPSMFDGGLTKIPEVDAVVMIYNPNRLKSAPRVIAPGSTSQVRRQTWGNW